MTQKKISIISPCFNEQENVEHCYQAIKDLFDGALSKYDYEHIFADNDSEDETVDILARLAEQDKNVKVVVNSRNYGPFRSTFNALRYAEGDAVLVMLPVDLQDPPELLVEFVGYWEQGYLKVYGVREQREESFVMRSVRGLYYKAVTKFAHVNIPVNTAEFQLLDRKVVDSLLQYQDHYPYIRGMIANVGFERKSKAVPYTWKERARGLSKNKFFSLVDQGLNGLISFTNLPMRLAMFVGVMISIAAIFYAVIQLIVNLIQPGSSPPGIATLIVAMFFFSGIQFVLIGIVGEYVSSIHSQVRHKDIVVEQELINISESNKISPKG
jgi:glycosyltransferase involved in cell wall biosynthesis